MNNIHPTALVHPKANLGTDVTVGPYSIIEEGVTIGDNTIIENHVVIKRGTQLGHHNRIHTGAVLGDDPQNLKVNMQMHTLLEIGHHNIIREYVTIHRASSMDSVTRVGDHCFLMGACHIGHDSHVGNNVRIANGALLAGHVTLHDDANISGCVAIHQFARVGRMAIIGGITGVSKDVPPFTMVVGRPAHVTGLNSIGMRRAGMDQATRIAIKRAFKTFCMSGLNTRQALADIEAGEMTKEVKEFVEFVKASKRGVTKSEVKLATPLQPPLPDPLPEGEGTQ